MKKVARMAPKEVASWVYSRGCSQPLAASSVDHFGACCAAPQVPSRATPARLAPISM
jgi:hypothetical protein